MFIFVFKKKASKEADELPTDIRRRILEKLKFYSLQENPLKFADKLKDHKFGEYRFRIGDYRILFDINTKDQVIIILKVGHRKDVYK